MSSAKDHAPEWLATVFASPGTSRFVDVEGCSMHIARHSFRQVDGSWTAKFDAAQTATISLALELKDALKDLGCRSAAIYGELTHLADETAPAAIAAASHGRTTAFILPGTAHYPLIDSPLAFVAAVKAVALSWIAEFKRTRRPD